MIRNTRPTANQAAERTKWEIFTPIPVGTQPAQARPSNGVHLLLFLLNHDHHDHHGLLLTPLEMGCTSEPGVARIPTLVEYCQRVAVMNLDLIDSLGDGFRPDLVQPILGQCDAESLQRFEDETPTLKSNTQDIWEALCLKTFPLATNSLKGTQPRCWRAQYFALRQEEIDRLDRVGSRMRKQREAAEDRRKEGFVKFTDRPPPMKRCRIWGMAAPPKTLFQKTKSEASKVQRSFYTRALPSMPNGKTYRVLPPPTTGPLLPSPSHSSSRVTVSIVRQPQTPSIPSTESLRSQAPLPSQKGSPLKNPSPTVLTPSPPKTRPVDSLVSQDASPALFKRKYPAKKDPISALFMPRHRAYSQRPS